MKSNRSIARIAAIALCVLTAATVLASCVNPNRSTAGSGTEKSEDKAFEGLSLLDNEEYVIRKTETDKIAALKPHKLERHFYYFQSMTEADEFNGSGKTAEAYVDADGNIYVKAAEVDCDDIYAVRIVDNDTARKLLDSKGLSDIGGKQRYILMHMLAQYPRMRLFYVPSAEDVNSFYASQTVLYFTDEHVVSCRMEQSAPTELHEYDSPYGTVIKVSELAGNEWAEKPWLKFGANDFDAYFDKVSEKLTAFWN